MKIPLLIGFAVVLLFMAGCRGSGETQKEDFRATAREPHALEVAKAHRVPDLLNLEEARKKSEQRLESGPLPEATDLPVEARPFEGVKVVRQEFVRPLPADVGPEVKKLARTALTFDPEEPEPATGFRLQKVGRELLELEAYDALDIIIQTLREKRLLAQDGTLLLGHLYTHLIPAIDETSITKFESWYQASPNSPAARYCLARAYTTWAWGARGGGWASEVTERGWKLFSERLKKAQELLNGFDESIGDPYPFALLITVGMGLGSPHEEVRANLDKAVAIAPYSSFSGYLNYDYYLFPRWHGSTEERSKFIEESVESTQAELGQGLYALFCEQSDELEVDKERVLQGYERLLADNPASFHYFDGCAEMTLKLQGPGALQALYQKVLDGELKLPLTEGDKLRLKHKLQREFDELKPPQSALKAGDAAKMLGANLGMTVQELESLLGKPSSTVASGKHQQQYFYQRSDFNYGFSIDNETGKLVSMAGPTAEVDGKSVRAGMSYLELEEAIGPPNEIRSSGDDGPRASYYLVYETSAMTVIWRAQNEKIFMFSIREDFRAPLVASPPVTLEEWKSTWKEPER